MAEKNLFTVWDSSCAFFPLFCKNRRWDGVGMAAALPHHPGGLLVVRGAQTWKQIDL